MERSNTLPAAGELETLNSFLDFQRATMIRKVEGLTDEQAASQPVAPSTLSLSGLIKHLSLVEESWFQSVFAGGELGEPWSSAPFDDDKDWEFNSASEDRLSDLVEMYESACEKSREVVASADSLGEMSEKDTRRGKVSLRWILLHMIEETARHAGHADLIRERIDGATGI
ncbi:MAG TPA: DinB family protein [Acidimicrobiia bacterium]|nr:DinB family protein [Acidimicrobiia bacterium]